MTRTLFSTTACLLFIAAPTAAPANDIIDFLRALNGGGSHRHAVPVQPVSRRHDHDHGRYTTTRHNDRHRTSRPVTLNRPGVSFQVSLGNSAPPRVPVIPQPLPYVPAPAPVPVYGGHVLPHQIGEVVTCPVALEPHVIIKDACEVAPGARPVIIAVRDPHLGRYRSRGCVEQIVYVEVLAPPCPLQRVRVSPCKTKIRLDYGKYEIDIVSRNDAVEIDYDD